MRRSKIQKIKKDEHNFLKDFIKENLPSSYYYLDFYRKIKNSEYIEKYEISPDLKRKIINYWENYEKINLMWHKAYIATTGIEDVRYIPEDVFYKKIEPALNDFTVYRAYADKNIYDKIFQEFKMPQTILRNMKDDFYDKDYNPIDYGDAIKIAVSYAKNNKLVLKPSIETGGGRNVKVLDLRSNNIDDITKHIIDLFKHFNSNFILQDYLEQHSLMSDMHEGSLNTLRIISIRLDNRVKILSSIVRMGNNGSKVDNATVGGLTCGFDIHGKLNSFATDHLKYKKYSRHPYSDFVFKGSIIPNYNKCFDLVKKAHKKIQYFDIVSWDVAVDSEGEPNLIEINLKAQDINFHQRNNGPLFGDLTDDILDVIFERR